MLFPKGCLGDALTVHLEKVSMSPVSLLNEIHKWFKQSYNMP